VPPHPPALVPAAASILLVSLVPGGAVPSARAPESRATSGVIAEYMDPAIRPQDDLFGHVNGKWLASAEIPREQVSHGALIELTEKVDLDLRALIESLTADRDRPGSAARQVRDLHDSLMDEAHLARLGFDPIRPQLKRIDALTTTVEFAREAGQLSATDAGGPFEASLAVDAGDPGAIVVNLSQSGIMLPGREYYLSADARYVEVRSKYLDYLGRIFELTGRAHPDADARAVLYLDTELARSHWSEADSRDPTKTANRFVLDRLPVEFPGFNWHAWARPQGIDRARFVVLAQPSFFRRFAQLVTEAPLDAWKAWLAARYITAAAPFLSKPFEDARFDFFGRELSGQEEPRLRWRRAVSLVSGYLGDAVGRLYVEKHFPAAARARAQKITDNVVAAFRSAIGDAGWMSASTRREALEKLARLITRIGYPDAWRDYSGLDIRPDDLFGNIQRARQFQNEERVKSVRGAGSRYWLVAPQTVNAYYNHATNELVVTAAILQPPVFNLEADDAVNYGAIGSMIGHELGHAFDQRGRLTDSRSAIRDWWAPEDARRFGERAAMLSAQFAAYQPVKGLNVNGELTLPENIGDLVGVSVAYQAYKLSLNGQRSPVIDGFTGEQRFFFGWAQVWRSKMREEYTRQYLMTSVHAPPRYRANGPVSNLDGFYEAFGVRPGDRLFRPPAERVRIW
jgi:predicted metalloendopeptidase